MAFIEGSSNGALTGVTEKILVAAPSSGVRRIVKYLSIVNNDTVGITISIRLKNTAGSTSIIWTGILDDGDTWEFGEDGQVLVLDTVNKSIVADLDAPPTTNQPEYTNAYGDVS